MSTLRNLPRGSIHHDTSLAFPQIVPLTHSQWSLLRSRLNHYVLQQVALYLEYIFSLFFLKESKIFSKVSSYTNAAYFIVWMMTSNGLYHTWGGGRGVPVDKFSVDLVYFYELVLTRHSTSFVFYNLSFVSIFHKILEHNLYQELIRDNPSALNTAQPQ